MQLIEALRSRKLTAIRAAIKANPGDARSGRAIVEAGRLASQAAVALLHRHAADLNASWRGYRPLHALLQERPHAGTKPPADRLACLEWMLEAGADPEQLGAWPPARAIIIAAFVGEPEYVKRLKKAGAKIDAFAAAALGDRKAVEKTLRARSEFAVQRDAGGLTAMQCAAGSRMPKAANVEIARLLLAAGADVRATTKSWLHDVDAIYFAASARNKAMFELFLSHGSDATDALTCALWNATEDFGDLALEYGANPDRAVAEGQPLLNNLIRWGKLGPALWMLAHGASPNVPDGNGWTAVHQAASRGNVRILSALIDAGGDLGLRDHRGRSPRDIAKEMGREKLIALLSAKAR